MTVATALCAKFEKATDMKICAEAYYSDMISLMQQANIHLWEAEIQDAENRRLDDRRAMDILKARRVDISAAEPQPAPQIADAQNNHIPAPEDWIQLGLDIQEQQSVHESFFTFTSNIF